MRLIFLTYINRSGSTFLANKLSEFPDVLVCPEAEVLIYELLVNPENLFCYDNNVKWRLLNSVSTDKKLKYWGLEEKDLESIKNGDTCFQVFIKILIAYRKKVNPCANIIVFKGTKLIDVFLRIPLEFKLQYNITLISLVRDGRASYASQRVTVDPYSSKPMNTNPVLAACTWNRFIEKCLQYEHRERFYTVSYEELIEHYNEIFNKILVYLDIQPVAFWQLNKNELYGRIPPDQKYIHTGVVHEADCNNINKWKKSLSPAQVYIFEKRAAEFLLKMDYELVHPKVNAIKLFFAEAFYILKYVYWKLRHRAA